MDDKPPRMYVCVIYLMEALGSQRDIETYVIEVTELIFEVRCDLRGRFEAAMASEAVEGNIHMDTRVIRVADVKSEVI